MFPPLDSQLSVLQKSFAENTEQIGTCENESFKKRVFVSKIVFMVMKIVSNESVIVC